MTAHKRRNIALELGVLEAHAGLEPAIRRSKSIAYVQRRRGPAPAAGEEGAGGRLDALRREAAARKVFGVQRVLRRAVKAAKQAALQKIIKRIKRAEHPQTAAVRSDGAADAPARDGDKGSEACSDAQIKPNDTPTLKEKTQRKVAALEAEMRGVKEADVDRVAAALFRSRVLASQPYLQERLGTAGDATEDEEAALVAAKVENKALLLVLARAAEDLETHLRRIWRDDKPSPPAQEPKVVVRDRPGVSEDVAHKAGVSVSQRSDAKRSGKGRESGKGQRVGNSRDMNNAQSSAAEARRNRKGQRARREEWERIYGSAAKHLQRQGTKAGAPGTRRGPGAGRPERRGPAAARGAPAPAAESAAELHPSWAAKRQMHAALSASSAPTRITFADD